MPRRKPRTNGRRLSALAAGALACGLLTGPASAAGATSGPTNLRMNPVPVNGSADSCGYVGALNPTVGTIDLFATVGDPNGPLVGAHFELHEIGNGNPTTWDSGWGSEAYGTHVAQARIPSTTLTDGKTYAWSVESGRANQPDPIRATGCTFTFDKTPPGLPVVTSQDFPTNGGGKYAGQQGVFIFDTSTAGPDIIAVEYSLNGPIPVGGAARAIYDAPSGTWRTPALTVTDWGSNTLSAQTVDRAGNTSQPRLYAFFAPSDPNPPAPKPGDINRDGKVDILGTDAAGGLRFYSAGDDPAAGGRVAASADEGPMDDYTWTGALVSHRGGDRADDLYTFAGRSLYLYLNSPGSRPADGYFNTSRQVVMPRPSTCTDGPSAQGTCASYARNWDRVKQIIAAGDVDGVPIGDFGDYTNDLFTIEEDATGHSRLWLFTGSLTTGAFDQATPIGPADRQNQDIIVPGDVTGDGIPELWARDRTDGKLYQYASAKNADGTVDLGAYSRTPTLIATGFDTAAYPQVSSDGDFDADGKADLWARTANGNVYTFPGQAPDSNGNVFGPAQLIAGS
ncbi:hypothetical protein OG948_30250 [Embleya sp. NBC_00888]|uniref:hypothetical protein n=1 Tax=Embleya sp. NBC_00888 TaxID=2975960 RepID=UPI00386EFBB5|nr:hypothetical protein OG948_30250 [Embleya sp. NBC_00888]